MAARTRVAVVIMAGGRGERLWPLVRSANPKVCVSPDGADTLLGATLERLRPFTKKKGHGALIVTTRGQERPIRAILPKPAWRNLLVEPEPKNTAACLALATAILAERDPSVVMAALPADHWIERTDAFQRSLRAAISVAGTHHGITMIGIRPSRVHSGLGHLCVGPLAERRNGCRVFRLRRFVEKPNPRTAQRLMDRQSVYWNAGIFVGRVTAFLDVFRRWLPHHAKRLFPLAQATGRPSFPRRAAAAYRGLEPISFDHGVMAHVRQGYVVEGQFGWEDLGSWDSWARVGQSDRPGLSAASRNVHVINTSPQLVVTLGLQDAIIVQTPDVILVCHAQHAQAVRGLVSRLSRDRQLSRYL